MAPRLNIEILDGSTKTVENISKTTDTIIVENVDGFLEKNGTILVDDEVIFYETAVASPSIALSPGISYDQVKLKWKTLANTVDQYDGTTRRFALLSQDLVYPRCLVLPKENDTTTTDTSTEESD